MINKYGTLVRRLPTGTEYYINSNTNMAYVLTSSNKELIIDIDIMQHLLDYNRTISISTNKSEDDRAIKHSVSLMDYKHTPTVRVGLLIAFIMGIDFEDVRKYQFKFTDNNPLNMLRSNIQMYRCVWQKHVDKEFIDYDILEKKRLMPNEINYSRCRVLPNMAKYMDTCGVIIKIVGSSSSIVLTESGNSRKPICIDTLILQYYKQLLDKLANDGVHISRIARVNVHKLDYSAENLSLVAMQCRNKGIDESEIYNTGILTDLPGVSVRNNKLIINPGYVNGKALKPLSLVITNYDIKSLYKICRDIVIEIYKTKDFTVKDIMTDESKYEKFVELMTSNFTRRYRFMLRKAKLATNT